MKAISGLVKPPLQILEGGVTYNFDGERLNILALNDEKQRRKLRGARLSLVPQGSMSVLNPVRRVRKSFEDVLYAHFDLSEQEFEDVVRKHLDALGLTGPSCTPIPTSCPGHAAAYHHRPIYHTQTRYHLCR